MTDDKLENSFDSSSYPFTVWVMYGDILVHICTYSDYPNVSILRDLRREFKENTDFKLQEIADDIQFIIMTTGYSNYLSSIIDNWSIGSKIAFKKA